MKSFSRRLQLTITAALLLTCALVFNSWLTFMTLDGKYAAAVADQYRLVASGLNRELETNVRYNRGLLAMTDLDEQLERSRAALLAQLEAEGRDAPGGADSSPTSVAVSVVLPGGHVLASAGSPRPDALHAVNLGETWTFVLDAGRLTLQLPLVDLQGRTAASVLVELEGPGVEARADHFLESIGPVVVAIAAAGVGILLVLVRRVLSHVGQNNKTPGRLNKALLLAVLGVVQLVSSGTTVFAFKLEHFDLSRAKAEVLLDIFTKEIESALALGIRLDQLGDLEVKLQDFLAQHPEAVQARVTTPSGKAISLVEREPPTDGRSIAFGPMVARTLSLSESGKEYEVRALLRAGNATAGVVSIRLSEKALIETMLEVTGEILTVLVVALLLTGELLVLVSHYLVRGMRTACEATPVHFSIVRPAVFFFLFGIDISMSFVPLHMEHLYEPILGLSEDLVMGLPISVEFLFVGVLILVAGDWLDRRGWHEPFIAGLMLAGAGVLYSSFAPNAIHFILSRAVVGAGFGLTLMAAQGFIIRHTDSSSRTEGLAHLFAGLYAGSLCGSAVGAMLADRVDYQDVFVLGAAVLACVMAYVLIFMREAFSRPGESMRSAASAPRRGSVGAFLGDRHVQSVMVFASLPAAVVVVGFLNYFVPVYLNRLGASQTTIGQILLCYGLSLVLLGPPIGRLVDRTGERRIAVIIGSLFGAVALISFNYFSGLLAALLAIGLLGVSSSLILASQSAFLLSLPASRRLGEGRAIGIFRASSRIGQVLGPVAFAAIVAESQLEEGMAALGVCYVVMCLLFLLTSRPRAGDADAHAVETAGPAAQDQPHPETKTQSSAAPRSTTEQAAA